MGVLDVIIILLILLSGVVGLKRGFFKEIVMTIGLLLVFIIAFKYKDPLANWMSLHLPFFDFGDPFKGISVLNIVLYQAIAFLIVASLLMIVFRIILFVSKIIEKILKWTIILSIPSKLLGMFAGLIEGYIIVFIALFILKQVPNFNIIMDGSMFADRILKSSPVLTDVVKKGNDAIFDVYNLAKNDNGLDNNEINKEALDILLKNKIVSVEYVEELIDCGKLRIKGVSSVLDKYR